MRAHLHTVSTWVFAGALLAGSLGAVAATQGDGTAPNAEPRQGPATIAAGFDHACALAPAGEAYCWGSNDSGELGDGSDSLRAEPTRVTGGLSFASISAGHNRTCAIASAGELYCWGKNAFGQIGDALSVRHGSKVGVPADGWERYGR